MHQWLLRSILQLKAYPCISVLKHLESKMLFTSTALYGILSEQSVYWCLSMWDLLCLLPCSAFRGSAQSSASPTRAAYIQKASHHLTYGLHVDWGDGDGSHPVTQAQQEKHVLSGWMLLHEVVQRCQQICSSCRISPLGDSPEKSTTASAVKPSWKKKKSQPWHVDATCKMNGNVLVYVAHVKHEDVLP